MRIAVLTESRADLGGVTSVFEEAKKRGHYVKLVESVGQIGPNFPHWFVFLGDRLGVIREVVNLYENFSQHREMGLVHLSGGDKQEGNLIDEQIRHALSKLAHVHFPCTTKSTQRLRSQGEDPERIYTVGSTMVEDLVAFVPVPISSFGEYILVLLHPAPDWISQMGEILRLRLETPIIILQPNNDPGFEDLEEEIFSVENLPRREFLNLLFNCKAFIGNSSAMYLEAQYLGIPCVQIGERNWGREQAFPGHMYYHCYPGDNLIKNIITAAMERDCRTKEGLRENWREGAHGDGTAAKKILDVLEEIGEPTPEFLRKEWR